MKTITITRLNNEKFIDLVAKMVEMKTQGLTYNEIDEALGLDIGTANSSYKILKTRAGKTVACTMLGHYEFR